MVYKPGTNKVDRVCRRADKLSNLLLRKICAISEMERCT